MAIISDELFLIYLVQFSFKTQRRALISSWLRQCLAIDFSATTKLSYKPWPLLPLQPLQLLLLLLMLAIDEWQDDL